MCIRDRNESARKVRAGEGTVVRDCAIACGAVAAVERSAAAVSYTHLRAHETVLDLVCRLLLEKKKYTRY
mgnify:CR=1 FL=1